MEKGIDVSQWQGNVDWNRVKNTDVEFAILRTGFGSASNIQIDTKFYEYLEGCNLAGLPTGAYHYGYAVSVDEARAEAQFCLSILNGASMPYCVWYDVEEQMMFNTGVQNLTNIVNAFCEEVENAGYKAGIYMSSSHAQRYADMSQINYYKWIAQYNSVLEYPGQYDMWQYTSSGRIDGIDENTVDLNYCYTDFEQNTVSGGFEWIWYNDHRKWAVKENGQWVYNKWIYDNNQEYTGWYRIDADGWLITQGWYKEGNYWYYLKPETGKMFTGWLWDENDKAWYYLDDEGRLVTNGWQWDDVTQGWYYLKDNGAIAVKEYASSPTEMSKYWTNENGKWVP